MKVLSFSETVFPWLFHWCCSIYVELKRPRQTDSRAPVDPKGRGRGRRGRSRTKRKAERCASRLSLAFMVFFSFAPLSLSLNLYLVFFFSLSLSLPLSISDHLHTSLPSEGLEFTCTRANCVSLADNLITTFGSKNKFKKDVKPAA